jgi:hypothetical protein
MRHGREDRRRKHARAADWRRKKIAFRRLAAIPRGRDMLQHSLGICLHLLAFVGVSGYDIREKD